MVDEVAGGGWRRGVGGAGEHDGEVLGFGIVGGSGGDSGGDAGLGYGGGEQEGE